ncbi:MAG: sulfate ABC transporter substrate-binding protein [Luteolibacter sp.]
MKTRLPLLLLAPLLFAATSCGKKQNASALPPVSLLNVSYDPTRELYVEVNAAFAKQWEKEHGQPLKIEQSHGGSGKQARSIIDGVDADVATLALSLDIDMLHDKSNLLPADWQTRLPSNSSPYTSTIVFIVRKGNPKGVKDWDDLIKGDTKVITPNPKTGGAPRWTYLAGWAWARRAYNGDENKAKEYIGELYRHVPVLDTGARGSTTTFAQRGIGDVLLSWENEAYLIEKEFPGQTEIVYPSISILAEPSVALVTRNAEKKGTVELATKYLEFLYTPEGQELAAKHYYRPRNPGVAKKYADRFRDIQLVTIDEEFGGWKKAQAIHFDDGGVFDQIYSPH